MRFEYEDLVLLNVFGIVISVTVLFPDNIHLPKLFNSAGNTNESKFVSANA